MARLQPHLMPHGQADWQALDAHGQVVAQAPVAVVAAVAVERRLQSGEDQPLLGSGRHGIAGLGIGALEREGIGVGIAEVELGGLESIDHALECGDLVHDRLRGALEHLRVLRDQVVNVRDI